MASQSMTGLGASGAMHGGGGSGAGDEGGGAPGCAALRELAARLRAHLSLKNNFTIRVCCVILMLKCAFVALTGRGVVSIIQAIGGVIFSIEGFWGAVKYDAATVKRFLIFLLCYFFVAVSIAIINLYTLPSYCETAVNAVDERTCLDTAALYSYLLLGVSLGLLPLLFGVGVVFYLAIQSNESMRVRRKDPAGAPGQYEMTEIVDRMGFSSD